jgi:hypothetical protein
VTVLGAGSDAGPDLDMSDSSFCGYLEDRLELQTVTSDEALRILEIASPTVTPSLERILEIASPTVTSPLVGRYFESEKLTDDAGANDAYKEPFKCRPLSYQPSCRSGGSLDGPQVVTDFPISISAPQSGHLLQRSQQHQRTTKYPEGQIARVTSLPSDDLKTAVLQDRKFPMPTGQIARVTSLPSDVEVVKFGRVPSVPPKRRRRSVKDLQDHLKTHLDARHSPARPPSRQQHLQRPSTSMSARTIVSSGAAFWASAVQRAKAVEDAKEVVKIPSTDIPPKMKESHDRLPNALPMSFTF